MNASEIIKSIEAEQLKAEVPEFRVGDTVKVYGKIKEGNRERIQVFEGVVIKRQGGSNRETFTVRKISNGCGVEKTWPLHSPNVEKVEVVRAGKVRRAKLFYLRDRVGKKAKAHHRRLLIRQREQRDKYLHYQQEQHRKLYRRSQHHCQHVTQPHLIGDLLIDQRVYRNKAYIAQRDGRTVRCLSENK